MKKLIVGVVLVGLLFAPVSSVKAQVVPPVDEAALRVQLQGMIAQLMQMIAALQAQILLEQGSVGAEQPPTQSDVVQENLDATFENECRSPLAAFDQRLAELLAKYEADHAKMALNEGGLTAGALEQLLAQLYPKYKAIDEPIRNQRNTLATSCLARFPDKF